MTTLQELLNDLHDRRAFRRWTAAGALQDYPSPEVVAALCQALQDSNSTVRFAAALSLKEIGGPDVLPALWKALADPDYLVRGLVLDAAETTPDAAAPEALHAALARELTPPVIRKDNLWVWLSDAVQAQDSAEAASFRYRLVRILGEVGDSQSIPHLLEALNHRDPTLRSHAGEAIGRLAQRCPGPGLREAVEPLRQMAVLNPADRSLYRKLLPLIERALGIENLPLPAASAAGAVQPDTPIPAAVPEPEPAHLPLPAHPEDPR